MNMKNTELELNTNRRRLLQGIGAAASSRLVLPLGLNLAAISSASAQTANDYRALVCVYLGGGNDHINMLVPSDTTSFNKYSQARGALTRARSTLLGITPTTSQGGKEVSMHANLAGIKSLFDAQKLAVVASTGPLIVPVTKTNYGLPTTPLPPQLFSHSDQGIFWMSSQRNGGQNGWCGRFGDLLAPQNTNSAFTTVSVFGFTKILVGQSTSFFVASEYGAPSAYFDAGSGLDAALTRSSTRKNLLEKAYAQVHENLRDNASVLSTAIVPESTFATPPGGGRNSLAQQLLTVARIIACRNTIGAKRQVFYVQLGGFDTHSGQNERHDALMTELNDALVYFDACMTTLNASKQVTLFTFSEFGRTLTSNGDGTDHGWAGHQLVMGGAVNGKNIYGTLPTIDSNSPDFLADGNQIPTIAVEQYGATLAKWMGVNDAGINDIFPNLGNFNQRDLGFLAA
jgi:uncharacterized protein (DUF1501 family)